ncbi:MAG TPA: response regulator, partial [Planctomycetota bacterium]|nr:response regulator [Planctomycetota bacterium]
VRDTGIGIPPEKLETIFELFSQANGREDTSRGGLGIGLTLARRIVEFHGGRITAHSAGSGKGSELEVRLPAKTGAAEEEPAASTPRLGALRVLIVEDSSEAAESLRMLLSFWGHDSRVIHDSAAAWVACRSYRPDVVLLDIDLPGTNGLELVERLSENEVEKPYIVAITGFGDEEHRRRAMEAGCDQILLDPVGPEELERLLVECGAKDGERGLARGRKGSRES